MASLKHFGGQDYYVIDGKKKFGPMDKTEAENMIKDIELENEPMSYEDGLAAFADIKRKLRGESFKDFFFENRLEALKGFVSEPFQGMDNIEEVKDAFMHKCINEPDLFLRMIRGGYINNYAELPKDAKQQKDLARGLWNILGSDCDPENKIDNVRFYIKKHSS